MLLAACLRAARRPSQGLGALRPRAVVHHLTSATLVLLVGAALLVGQLPAGSSAGATAADRTSGVRVVDHLDLVSAGERTRGERVKRALRIARAQVGDRYRYGAEGPRRFDCSGLVYYAAHRAGFTNVPRTSAEQGRAMRHVKRSRMRRGDFVFFTGSSGVYHVGVYVGRRDGRRAIVHAPRPGTRVRVEQVWTDSWFAATLRR